MFHKIYHPHPALQAFVNNIMIHQVVSDPSLPRHIFAHPPLPEQNLVFYPYDPVQVENLSTHQTVQLPSSIVLGRRVSRINLLMGHNHLFIKVGFQPGGLFRLLGIPMNELAFDEGYNSTDIVGKEMQYITEQLREAPSFDDMVKIVEGYLLSKVNCLKIELPIDRALPCLIKKGGLINVNEMASQACVSTRQLERLFHQRIGFTPKFFARLIRFSQAWIIKENNPKKKWTNIAHQCGYFDQMHLIHDFKEFAGVLPTVIEEEFRKAPFSLRHQHFH